ncbi:MAG: hypothetical protein RL689_112 [Planctomycetota bacterium]
MAAVNADAIRPLFDLAARARVDVVGIGDSNQLQRSNGWDQGWHKALAERFGLYATGVVSWGEGQGQGAGQGFGYSALSSGGGGFTYAGAPSEAAAFLDSATSLLSPHNYVHVPVGASVPGTSLAGGLFDPTCPIDISGPLRLHFSYGRFAGSGIGSFQPLCRFENFPFETIVVGPTLPTRSGTAGFELAYGAVDVPAAARSRPISLRASPQASTIVGPFIAYHLRAENRSRARGAAFSSLYALGSKSSNDMARALVVTSDATLTHYFDSLRRLQGPSKAILVRINTGLNDRAESRPSVRLGLTPGNSAAAYQDNLLAIIERLRAIWTLNGWPQEELHFLLTASHPVAEPDEASLRSYRQACDQLARSQPRTATVRLDVITSASEMIANRWYQANNTDRNHLTEAAYDALASRELTTLLKPPCVADFNVDGGVDGADVAAFFEAWQGGDFLADVNDDGGVDGGDAGDFMIRWTAGDC